MLDPEWQGSEAPGEVGRAVALGPRKLISPGVLAMVCSAFDGELLLPEDIEQLHDHRPLTAGSHESKTHTEVFTSSDDSAIAVVRVDYSDEMPIAHLDLLATDAGHRRRGKAGLVLDAAENWAIEMGADWIEVGDHIPWGLFSGVDVRWTAAMCLFGTRGYERVAVKLDLACPTISTSPARPGAGLRAVRVEEDDQIEDLRAFVAEVSPRNLAAFDQAGEWGTAVVAVDGKSGCIFGAAAHSLQRTGVIGPVIARAGVNERILTAVLMRTVLSDLATAGVKSAEIVGALTMPPYVDSVGAKVARVSLVLRRKLV